MKINSKKVAELSGVSRSTVSRVINNYSNVPEETKKKVLKVINEMGYIPNSNAQALVGKKNRTIGLFIYGDHPKESLIIDNGLSFGYYLDFINRTLKEALTLEHQLLVDVINEKNCESIVNSLFFNGNIAGAIFVGFRQKDPFIESLIKKDYAICLIDYCHNLSEWRDNLYLVNTSDFIGAKIATEHLLNLGAKKILHLTGDKTKLSAIERERGYISALKENGVHYSAIYDGNYDKEKAYEIMLQLLKNKFEFDGIFAANDNMSYGVLRALKEYNLSNIPLIGFDNLKFTVPLGIMSISPKVEQAAAEAVKSIILENYGKKEAKYIDVILIKNIDDYINNEWRE